MRLRRPLPAGRTSEQLQRHYEAEKEIASRLRRADRAQRKAIYASMYDDLFARVPDHPRLIRRFDDQLSERAIQSKFTILKRFVGPDATVVEFAPGDCRFAYRLCDSVRFVYALDISDQRQHDTQPPTNFKLIVYDGYEISLPGEIADVVFSDQLLEHIHPEDARQHVELARSLLKPNGVYVMRTPHRFSGPHDVSQYFSDEPEGFHLKEYANAELADMLLHQGRYSSVRLFWSARGWCCRLPRAYFGIGESLFGSWPYRWRRRIARALYPDIVLAAVK